jgi:hypothetical protein
MPSATLAAEPIPLRSRLFGEHQWVIVAGYHVDPRNPAMHPENLISVEGPGCRVCEQNYTPELAERRCPGEPRG